MMLCPECTDVDTRVSYRAGIIPPQHPIEFDTWWCANCGAMWTATFRGEFIQMLRAGA